jgi:gluconolactonase
VEANGIEVFHPDGKLAATIPVRDRPSNCAFGGPDAMTLFITARGNLYRAKVDVKGIF